MRVSQTDQLQNITLAQARRNKGPVTSVHSIFLHTLENTSISFFRYVKLFDKFVVYRLGKTSLSWPVAI